MYFLSIIILCCSILQILPMPTQVLVDYDKDAKVDSYEDSYMSDSDDYLQSKQKSLLEKVNGKDADRNGELERARLERDYLENNGEDQEESIHSTHNDMLSTNKKRTEEYNKGSDMLFEKHENPHTIQKNEYNENECDDSGQLRQKFRHFNQFTQNNAGGNADKRFVNKGDSVSRDRREINNSDGNESVISVSRDRREISNSDGNESVINDDVSEKLHFNTNEDEETAIKRHIKKLSKKELNELISTLSEDKRALLKNIIDSSQQEIDTDTVNKREITKKSGANEENSLVGNEPSDTSKIQGGTAGIEEESLAPNTEKFENVKKQESETLCSKSTEPVTSSEKPTDTANALDSIENSELKKSDNKDDFDSAVMQTKIQTDSNEQESTKNEKKRELNQSAYVSNDDPEVRNENSDDLFCSENERISPLWNEESKLYSSNNIDKREVCDDNSDPLKSLEESFPNSDNLSQSKRDSNMVPLVRVKRTDYNKLVQRRDSNAKSNLKVPFFSNAVEENEYDTDEGNEFEGDGIFNKRSNFAKSETNKHGADSSTNEDCDNYNSGNNNGLDKHNHLESDTVSLGSDTDAVLSGIEGVDDNMMYNSVSRNRRTLDKFNSLNVEDDEMYHKQKNMPKVISEYEYNESSESSYNVPRYQENDAFGSLPRNYEEDLGRFKRIRRLKPFLNKENSLPLNR